MVPESPDPTVIRSLAITAEDVVAALEANRTSDRRAVLRVTPPFSGRMRARIHVATAATDDEAVHIDPSTLLAPDAPTYPRPSETEDELRADPDEEYSVDRHHEYHAAAVEEWRSAVTGFVRDRVTIESDAGSTEVEIHLLG